MQRDKFIGLKFYYLILQLDNDYDYIYYGFPGEEYEENNEILQIVKTNSVSTNSIAIRKYFPETWLWTEIANIRLNVVFDFSLSLFLSLSSFFLMFVINCNFTR